MKTSLIPSVLPKSHVFKSPSISVDHHLQHILAMIRGLHSCAPEHDNFRLFNSPSLGTVGVSIGFERLLRFQTMWLTDLNIDGKTPPVHRILGNLYCIMGSRDPVGFHTVFKRHWQSPCTALTAGNLPPVRAVQGDCETVYDNPAPVRTPSHTRRTRTLLCEISVKIPPLPARPEMIGPDTNWRNTSKFRDF